MTKKLRHYYRSGSYDTIIGLAGSYDTNTDINYNVIMGHIPYGETPPVAQLSSAEITRS